MPYSMPVFWVVLTVTISVIGSLLVRKYASHELLRETNDVAGFIYAVIGVIYAVVLGLVLVSTWERSFDAQTSVAHEASIVGALYRGASALPDADEERLQNALRTYRTAVVDKEWVTMQTGDGSTEAREALLGVYVALHSVEPTTVRESIWLTRLIEDVNSLADVRQERLASARTSLPTLLWVVVIVGAAIVIAFSYLFGTPAATPAVLMIAALTATIALTVVTLAALDRPFSGEIRVQPDAFEQLDSVFTMWKARAP